MGNPRQDEAFGDQRIFLQFCLHMGGQEPIRQPGRRHEFRQGDSWIVANDPYEVTRLGRSTARGVPGTHEPSETRV